MVAMRRYDVYHLLPMCHVNTEVTTKSSPVESLLRYFFKLLNK
jgi:hypothetical protein